LLSKLQVADNKEEAAANVSSFLNSSIIEHDVPVEFFADFAKQLKSKDAEVASSALIAYAHIASKNNLTPSVEPYVVQLAPEVAAKTGDKNKEVAALAETAFACHRRRHHSYCCQVYLAWLDVQLVFHQQVDREGCHLEGCFPVG
ncbi:hypothetical protein OXX79_013040, partial [Metschnikowia pulcherrima]